MEGRTEYGEFQCCICNKTTPHKKEDSPGEIWKCVPCEERILGHRWSHRDMCTVLPQDIPKPTKV